MKRPRIKFFLREDYYSAKTDSYPLYVRITYNRESVKSSLPYRSNFNHFFKESGRFKQDGPENEFLNFFEDRILTIWRDLILKEEEISAPILLDLAKGGKKKSIRISEYISNYLKKLEKSSHHSPATIETYNAKFNHFLNFIKSINESNLRISQVTYKHIQEFDLYMCSLKHPKKDKGYERSTINKIHDLVSQLLNMAENDNLLAKNPYKKFKRPRVENKNTIKYLTPEELENLIDHDLGGNERLKRIKDMFLFSCYTGLRFSDVQELKVDEVKKVGGKWYLVREQVKTKINVNIPLIEPAYELFIKYKDDNRYNLPGYIFPKISNQKTNTYLKEIGTLSGVDKTLNFHCARHTFGTLLLSSGMREEEVSQLMGHTNVNMTRIYAKILPENFELMRESMEKLFKKFGNGEK